MPDKDDAIVEAMARARCKVVGFDPDAQDFAVWTAEGEVVWPYAWHAEREPAAKQLAAHRAMIKAGKEEQQSYCRHKWVWSHPHAPDWISTAVCQKCGKSNPMAHKWEPGDAAEKEIGE